MEASLDKGADCFTMGLSLLAYTHAIPKPMIMAKIMPAIFIFTLTHREDRISAKAVAPPSIKPSMAPRVRVKNITAKKIRRMTHKEPRTNKYNILYFLYAKNM